jgi:nitroreductase
MSTERLSDNPPFFDLVGQMRAMRRLEPDPIPLALVRKVLEAGVQAPSGMNSQPWAFVAVRDPAGRAWFAERYRAALYSRFDELEWADSDDSPIARQIRALRYQAEHMQEFPLILLVCGKRDWPFKVPERERVGLAPPNYGAVYPCVQNILLACRALGLGAALTTMHQVFEDELHERFGIPTDYGVVVSIPIGFPMGKFGPVTRRPAAELTYFDAWGNLDAKDWT